MQRQTFQGTNPLEPGSPQFFIEEGEDVNLMVIAEQEHYLLVSDGKRCTVVERRAGKFYPLCNGVRHGLDLDDEGIAQLVTGSASCSEWEGRKRLADVAGRWRDLFEHVR
ncbi:MAG TPA: hypothetical protein VGI78_05935 [Acetobacteraceae bacterium]